MACSLKYNPPSIHLKHPQYYGGSFPRSSAKPVSIVRWPTLSAAIDTPSSIQSGAEHSVDMPTFYELATTLRSEPAPLNRCGILEAPLKTGCRQVTYMILWRED